MSDLISVATWPQAIRLVLLTWAALLLVGAVVGLLRGGR